MGLRYSFKRSRPKRRYRTKQPRFISSTSTTPQTQGMLFTPRSLGNPLATSERKYFDTTLVNKAVVQVSTTFTNAMANPTTFNTIVVPVTGAEYNQRIGRRISLLNWKIRGELILPAISDSSTMTSVSPIIVRLIACIDKQANGTQMASTDLIAMPQALNAAWDMFQNPGNFGRFKVLKDKRFTLQDPNYNSTSTDMDRNRIDRDWETYPKQHLRLGA